MSMHKLITPFYWLMMLIFLAGLSACGGGDAAGASTPVNQNRDLNPDLVLLSGDEGEISFKTLSPGNIEQFVTGNYSSETSTVSGILAK